MAKGKTGGKRKHAGGRAPKLTKELVRRAIELKGNGLSNQDICTACDISEAAFYRWQQQCKTPLQRELVEGLKRAEADYKNALLENIKRQGAERDWKAHAWLLERKYPAEFGRVDRVQAEVNQTTAATVQVVHCFDYGDEDGEGEEC